MALILSHAELRLKNAAASGEIAKFENVEDRTIRGEVIQMLCCGGQPDWPVSPEGVSLEGGTIVGRLNLSNRRVKRPLALRHSLIPDGINLKSSRTRTIDLTGSRISCSQAASGADEQAAFYGERMHLDGELLLNEAVIIDGCGFANATITGQVSANNATVTGRISVNDATRKHTVGRAFNAQNCDCVGFSLDGATVTGTCDINGARIKGDFAAEGTTFDGPEGVAISAFSTCIDAWFMRPRRVRDEDGQPTRVRGMINLTHAQIARDIDIRGAQLSAGYPVAVEGEAAVDTAAAQRRAGYPLAIAARDAVIRGSVFIEQNTTVDGCVRLRNADIKGQLRLTDSVITSAMLTHAGSGSPPPSFPDVAKDPESAQWIWQALDLTEAKIGHLVMPHTKATRPRGIVDLSRARIGTFTDFKDAWPPQVHRTTGVCAGRPCDHNGRDADHLVLDGLEYEHLDQPDGLPANRTGPVAEARFDWLRGQSREDIFERLRPQPWRQLGKVLVQQGYEDDARSVAIERRVAQRYAKDVPRAAKALSWTLHRLADYGFNPWKSASWSGVLVLLFAFVYLCPTIDYGDPNELLLGANQRVFVRTLSADFAPGTSTLAEARAQVVKVYPSFDPIMYSLDVFLPFVDLGMEKYWRADTTTWLGVFLYYLSVFEGIIGTVMISLVVTGFTGLLTRDER